MDLWLLVWIFIGIAGVSALVVIRIVWLIYRNPIVVRAGLGLPSVMNCYVLLAYGLLAVESSPFENTMSDYGAPLSFVSMIVVAPIGACASSVFARLKPLAAHQVSYLNWSRMFWALQIVPGLLLLWFMAAWAAAR